MNQGTPSPEPDRRRLSLESLEEKLRALPPVGVPEALPSKLIAAIPPAKAAGSLASGAVRRWPWIVAIGVLCVAVSAVSYLWLVHWNSTIPRASEENRDETAPATTGKGAPTSSKAVEQYEQTVRFDPYNADAWFSLAKAQAGVHRSADAISSAQKAIDIARSRNRLDLVGRVEAWLRSYRAAQSGRSPP